MVNHLSWLEIYDHITDDALCIQEEFLNEQLFVLDVAEVPWFANIVNLLVASIYPLEAVVMQFSYVCMG